MYDGRRTRIAVIGATGSVGASVLDICGRFPEYFDVVSLASNSNEKELIRLARLHGATKLCLSEPLSGTFKADGYKCVSGIEGLCEIAADSDIDHVVFASSGVSAIPALQTALTSHKDVSLANKESIVVAGPWVMPLVNHPDQLRPIDSEHSAIWQCLRGDPYAEIKNIWLTASGGPFKDYTRERMKTIRPADALKHPVWRMGAKITIDSATLMNKGIECIEAMQLFDLPFCKVSALIHPKSQVHGMVLFCDGTMKMLLSQPDMRIPAAAALAWPDRLELTGEEFNFVPPAKWSLDFTEIDSSIFPCFDIACKAGKAGGAYPSLLIGADEVAVANFLEGKIPYTSIPEVIGEVFSKWKGVRPRSLDEAISLVDEGRRLACDICKKLEA